MKTDEMNLTVDELEELCRLYMDCKLSVLEEKELEYVLSEIPLTSPSIDVVRSLMGIQTLKLTQAKPTGKKIFWKWSYAAGIAASAAILFGIGFAVLSPKNSPSTVPVDCIAYVNGNEIHGDAAMAHIESETRKAEEFINRMAELEEEEQSKIEQFMNHQNEILQ
jgi:predicted RecB family nuclease